MPGSVGHLFLGTTMKIVKQDGSLANYGEQGELWVRSPQVALGYYRNEKVCVSSPSLLPEICAEICFFKKNERNIHRWLG